MTAEVAIGGDDARTPSEDPVPDPEVSPADPELRDGPPPVRWGERALLLAGLIGLGVAVIGTRSGVFTPDTRPDLYQDPSRFLASTIEAWVGGASGLGQANFNSGAAPVAAVVWVIRTLGAPAWLAVRIWRLLLLVVAAWGIRRYLGALFGPRLTVAGRVVATVFWVCNPYVIVAGSTTPVLLPYALLPWTMLALLKATRDPRSWRWPAVFGLGFFAQTGMNAGVIPFFQLLAIPAHLAHARWVEHRRWSDLLRVLVRCGVCSLAVSLYWILPSMLAAGTGAGIAGSSEDPRDVARTTSYAESARLMGNWPMYGRAGDRLFLGGYTVYLTNGLVLASTFLVPVVVGLSLWRSRARERLLAVVLLAVGLPVMVGLFPPFGSYPAGRGLGWVFDNIGAALAFRTTNKVGAVVVLAETVALVIGMRAWGGRPQERLRRSTGAVGLLVVTSLLVAVSAPLWNGGLYPLGYEVPGRWERALTDLDGRDGDARVLVVPGGTGGNYRWGMRSPDDVFSWLLERPLAVRNTVTGLDDPAGNMLSGFDTALALGSIPPGTVAAAARYLGASDVLVRNDLLTEEIGGPAPARVMGLIGAEVDLTLDEAYGTKGTDTVPGRSGALTRRGRRERPADAALRPLATYRVADPRPVVVASEADRQVLVDGDGEALMPLVAAEIVDGTQPLRLLGDLDDESFAEAVADGGRLVLTDTNRRRASDTGRVTNATSPTLEADGDLDEGNGITLTRWPDDPSKQTVAVVEGVDEVGGSTPGFGLHPYGRPSNAFDSDPNSAWFTGGLGTGIGDSVWAVLDEPVVVERVDIGVAPTEPAKVTVVGVTVGNKRQLQTIPADGSTVSVVFDGVETDRIEVQILDASAGFNPLGIGTVRVDGVVARQITRLPLTYSELYEQASPQVRAAADELPLDVLLTRARGDLGDDTEDEEAQLDRAFTIPSDRSFTFTAELRAFTMIPEVLDEVRAGSDTCFPVAVLDGEAVLARVISTDVQVAQGRVLLEGCDDIALDAGDHELLTTFGWLLDSVRLSSAGAAPPADGAGDQAAVEVVERTPTRVVADVPAGEGGSRLLRLGVAFDPRWSIEVDGRDGGAPIVLDGYSVGWRIDGDAHRVVATFGPQTAVEATFVASALSLVGLVAVAILPTPARWRRDDEPDDGGNPGGTPSGAGPGDGPTDGPGDSGAGTDADAEADGPEAGA